MDLKELRKLPMPKLRDLAKQKTELQGVVGMEKEDLIKALAAAIGIAYDQTHKDLNAIHAVKQDIRALQKQKLELLAANAERDKRRGLRRKIKLLKRTTRHLAHDVKLAAVSIEAKAAAEKAAAAVKPAAPAEAPPAA
jgi:hypothetical protein